MWGLKGVRHTPELVVQVVLLIREICLARVWLNIPDLAFFSLVYFLEFGLCSSDVNAAKMFHQHLMRPWPPPVWYGANAALQLMKFLIVSCAGRLMVSARIRPLDWLGVQ